MHTNMYTNLDTVSKLSKYSCIGFPNPNSPKSSNLNTILHTP